MENEKKSNNVSNYEHLLKMCGKYGMDIEKVRYNLEYQILVDFIMSGHDRHLNNIAFLRDADSLGQALEAVCRLAEALGLDGETSLRTAISKRIAAQLKSEGREEKRENF